MKVTIARGKGDELVLRLRLKGKRLRRVVQPGDTFQGTPYAYLESHVGEKVDLALDTEALAG